MFAILQIKPGPHKELSKCSAMSLYPQSLAKGLSKLKIGRTLDMGTWVMCVGSKNRLLQVMACVLDAEVLSLACVLQ